MVSGRFRDSATDGGPAQAGRCRAATPPFACASAQVEDLRAAAASRSGPVPELLGRAQASPRGGTREVPCRTSVEQKSCVRQPATKYEEVLCQTPRAGSRQRSGGGVQRLAWGDLGAEACGLIPSAQTISLRRAVWILLSSAAAVFAPIFPSLHQSVHVINE